MTIAQYRCLGLVGWFERAQAILRKTRTELPGSNLYYMTVADKQGPLHFCVGPAHFSEFDG